MWHVINYYLCIDIIGLNLRVSINLLWIKWKPQDWWLNCSMFNVHRGLNHIVCITTLIYNIPKLNSIKFIGIYFVDFITSQCAFDFAIETYTNLLTLEWSEISQFWLKFYSKKKKWKWIFNFYFAFMIKVVSNSW